MMKIWRWKVAIKCKSSTLREYHWLCARTECLEQIDEEREAILKKDKELKGLIDKMRELLEGLTGLLKENKPSTFREA